MVKLLLAKDRVDLNSKSKFGPTPLMYAAWGGHEAVIKLLLAKDDVNPDFNKVSRVIERYPANEES